MLEIGVDLPEESVVERIYRIPVRVLIGKIGRDQRGTVQLYADIFSDWRKMHVGKLCLLKSTTIQ